MSDHEVFLIWCTPAVFVELLVVRCESLIQLKLGHNFHYSLHASTCLSLAPSSTERVKRTTLLFSKCIPDINVLKSTEKFAFFFHPGLRLRLMLLNSTEASQAQHEVYEGRLEAPEDWLEVSEAWLEASEACFCGKKNQHHIGHFLM